MLYAAIKVNDKPCTAIVAGTKESLVNQVYEYIRMEDTQLVIKMKDFREERSISRGDDYTDKEWASWVTKYLFNKLQTYGYATFRTLDWKD